MSSEFNCIVCGNKERKKVFETKDYFFTQEAFSIYECTSCGYRFTQPFPLDEKLGLYYKSENYVSHSDTNKGLFFSLYQRVKKYNIRKKVKLVEKHIKGGHILDYGCGTGDFLNGFSRTKWELTGIEPDNETRTYAINKNKITVLGTDGLANIPEASVDVITLWHVLEHIPNINKKITELKRVLKPNGIMIIAVPNCASFDALHYGKYWAAYDVPRHLHHFNDKTLKRFLENENLKIEEFKNMYFDSFYVSILSEKYKKSFAGFLLGVFYGFLSNLFTLGKKFKASSIIFTIKLK